MSENTMSLRLLYIFINNLVLRTPIIHKQHLSKKNPPASMGNRGITQSGNLFFHDLGF